MQTPSRDNGYIIEDNTGHKDQSGRLTIKPNNKHKEGP